MLIFYIIIFGLVFPPIYRKHNFKLIIMSQDLENQEIRIKIKDGKYFLSRYDQNGKVKEQYAPQDKKTIQVFIVSVMNGLQPPHNLHHLDKLSD